MTIRYDLNYPSAQSDSPSTRLVAKAIPTHGFTDLSSKVFVIA
jgi:hypothetical protein